MKKIKLYEVTVRMRPEVSFEEAYGNEEDWDEEERWLPLVQVVLDAKGFVDARIKVQANRDEDERQIVDIRRVLDIVRQRQYERLNRRWDISPEVVAEIFEHDE